jgi:glycosyltransferase involved in cell wall biosynthesis
MTLARMWPFQDLMAARQDLDYSVHLLGRYRGDPEAIRTRAFVHQSLPKSRLTNEVWLIRGWNSVRLVLAAYSARARGLPLMLWNETPGRTYEALTWREAVRIRARELLLPQLFRAYRGCVLLGIGELATRRFAELAPGSRVHLLAYPDDRADALLASPDGDYAQESRQAPRLLFVGELSHRKGFDVLVQACEKLWAEGLEFSIRYAGSGPMEGLARIHAARSGGRAEVLGQTDGEALLNLYRTSDGFVLPSRWDGWGLVVHEALAAGLPVVVSDKCGARILSRDCGVIVEAASRERLAQGLRWCISLTPSERAAMRLRARAHAAELTMERVADALVGHVREALAFSAAKAPLP